MKSRLSKIFPKQWLICDYVKLYGNCENSITKTLWKLWLLFINIWHLFGYSWYFIHYLCLLLFRSTTIDETCNTLIDLWATLSYILSTFVASTKGQKSKGFFYLLLYYFAQVPNVEGGLTFLNSSLGRKTIIEFLNVSENVRDDYSF
jgi:hypothetical protein